MSISLSTHTAYPQVKVEPDGRFEVLFLERQPLDADGKPTAPDKIVLEHRSFGDSYDDARARAKAYVSENSSKFLKGA